MASYTATVKGTQKLYGFYGNGNGATYTITVTNGTGVMKKFDVIRRPIRGGIPNVVQTGYSGTAVTYTENARFDFELEIWADVTTVGTFTATVTSSAGGDNITMATVNTDPLTGGVEIASNNYTRREKLKRAAAAAFAFNPEDAPVASGATQAVSNVLNGTLTKSVTMLGNPTKFLTYGGRRAANTSSNRVYFPVSSSFPAAGNLTGIMLEGNNDYQAFGAGISICTESAKVAFGVFGYVSKYFRVLVDGQYINKSYVAFSNDGVQNYVEVDFAGVYKQRTITLEMSTQVGCYGVYVEATADVSAPQVSAPITALFTGDSYGEGQGATSVGMGGFAHQAAKRLGWTDPRQVAVGSTGYLQDAGAARQKLRDQIPRWLGINTDLSSTSVDVIVVASGYNDYSLIPGTYSVAQVAAEAANAVTAIRATFPNSLIIVFGPWSGIRNNDATTVALENAIFTAVNALNDPFVKTAPVSTDVSPWQYGTGKVGATNGSGNTDRGVSADGIHPSDQGHTTIALRMTQAVRKIIANL